MSNLKRWAKEMRASWITSLIAGVLFGAVAATIGPPAGILGLIILVIVFLASTLVGVFGVSQMKEMLEERKRRGLGFFGVLAESEDFKRFYLPAWGRMLIWFVTTSAVAIALRGLIA